MLDVSFALVSIFFTYHILVCICLNCTKILVQERLVQILVEIDDCMQHHHIRALTKYLVSFQYQYMYLSLPFIEKVFAWSPGKLRIAQRPVSIVFLKIGDECIACRERVAVFNMSYFAKFLLTGPDSDKAVDWIFTNNMKKPPGRAFFVFRYAINDF